MGKPLKQITFEFDENEENPEFTLAKEPAPADPKEVIVTESKPTPRAGKRGRKPLRDTAAQPIHLDVPDDEILFQKQYYPIGEVAAMFHENQSLIRYWETEFEILQPRKNRKGDRYFRPIDIKNLVLIHDLLRRRKFTIEGAREYLKKDKKAEEKFAMIKSLEKIKGFLQELRASL
jgi:DNA-binding transcriptional MerR regulator